MPYQSAVRNFDRIGHEALRRLVDERFNRVHDELSACYYERKPFRDRGVLTKEQFEKLHGLIFLIRDVVLYRTDQAQPTPVLGTAERQASLDAAKVVAQLKAAGYSLPDLEA